MECNLNELFGKMGGFGLQPTGKTTGHSMILMKKVIWKLLKLKKLLKRKNHNPLFPLGKLCGPAEFFTNALQVYHSQKSQNTLYRFCEQVYAPVKLPV